MLEIKIIIMFCDDIGVVTDMNVLPKGSSIYGGLNTGWVGDQDLDRAPS